jgi:hypothetical protein
MKIVRVTYTTKPEYAEQNQENIKRVMSTLKSQNNPGVNYNACIAPDGISFIHTAFFETEEDEKRLTTLPEFIQFQQELKAGGLEAPPKQELLTLVGSSTKMF